MRALIQRVKRCSVTVNGKILSSIGQGILIFLGIKFDDSELDAKYLAKKCSALRIFNDNNGKMNLSLKDIHGEAMVVSQFTLYGDTRHGNRPSYSEAASPKVAENLYKIFVKELKINLGEHRVRQGEFKAMMDVELINDGPVTLSLESKKT